MTSQGTARANPPVADLIRLDDGRWIRGFVDDGGYAALLDVFVANFLVRGDVGAACAVYANGRPVVDLWGGLADVRAGVPWSRETSAVIFSCSKGLLAICIYSLVQDGRLDLDAPIAKYWPAFADHGKQRITVREAMCHRAGLPCLDVDLTQDEALAWDPVIRAIERQAPLFSPSAGHLYHALTYGWLVGEVIRRISGQSPGRFFQNAVAAGLDLRCWIGLPPRERPMVAWMEPPLPDEASEAAHEAERISSREPMVARSLTMGGAFAFPTDRGQVTFNDPRIQAAEIPGANGIATARSLARLYASCVSDIGVPSPLTGASLADAMRVQSEGRQLSGVPDDGARWGTGFQLASPPSQPMLGSGSFGHAGAGGQLAFGDIERRVGFGYLSNQMGGYGDARARELTTALRRVLRA